jgi:hypothetical protein
MVVSHSVEVVWNSGGHKRVGVAGAELQDSPTIQLVLIEHPIGGSRDRCRTRPLQQQCPAYTPRRSVAHAQHEILQHRAGRRTRDGGYRPARPWCIEHPRCHGGHQDDRNRYSKCPLTGATERRPRGRPNYERWTGAIGLLMSDRQQGVHHRRRVHL